MQKCDYSHNNRKIGGGRDIQIYNSLDQSMVDWNLQTNFKSPIILEISKLKQTDRLIRKLFNQFSDPD